MAHTFVKFVELRPSLKFVGITGTSWVKWNHWEKWHGPRQMQGKDTPRRHNHHGDKEFNRVRRAAQTPMLKFRFFSR